jgi:hypothetical protein
MLLTSYISTGLMFSSINHIEKYGSAKAGHLRAAEAKEAHKSEATTPPALTEDSLRDTKSEEEYE